MRTAAVFLLCNTFEKRALSLFFLYLGIVLISGCGYPFEFRPESEIRQEVIELDPSFSAVLDKKAELDGKIAELDSELSLNTNEIKSKIHALKRELSFLRQESAGRTEAISRELDPYRSEISQSLMELSAEYKLRRSSLSAINRMIAGLKKLSQQSGQTADSGDDISKWQEKIDYQTHQADILKQEIDALNQEIRTLRLKQRLLKFR
jgi:chromosome segregation ATPase